MSARAVDPLSVFTALAELPSPPGSERQVADRVSGYLRASSLEVSEDDAGAQIGSDTGNLLARLAPTVEDGLPIFLCAHLDTVPLEGTLEPVVTDGVVRNAGGTILGADNKAAVAAMLVAADRIQHEGRPHAGVELLFTPKEEVGLLGASAFDSIRLHARVGFVYDQAGPIGEVILGAPFQRALDVRFRGRAAHAGMVPEEGRSAIEGAARAIADFRLGRLDEETTASVGLIQGGTAPNVVPEHCSFTADVRCHDEGKLLSLVQEMIDTVTFAAGLAECQADVTIREGARGYRFREGDLPVRLASDALRRAGYEPRYALTGGGADANVFNARGLECLNLANGMANIHTPAEEISVADLEGMVEVSLALVEAARDAR